MLLVTIAVDLLAYAVLLLVELMPLCRGQMATIRGHILHFLAMDALVLGVELLCLVTRQLPVLDPLIDAPVLFVERSLTSLIRG
jgi:hypothetical protein